MKYYFLIGMAGGLATHLLKHLISALVAYWQCAPARRERHAEAFLMRRHMEEIEDDIEQGRAP